MYILCSGDEEKKQLAVELKRRIFLKLSEYEKLLSDLGNDPELMMDIINKIEPKLKPTAVDQRIVGKFEVFEKLFFRCQKLTNVFRRAFQKILHFG